MVSKWSLLLGFVLAGCGKQETAQVPEPPVHNVVTDYVDSRVQALDKAQATADLANKRVRQINQQTQAPSEP